MFKKMSEVLLSEKRNTLNKCAFLLAGLSTGVVYYIVSASLSE